jgi:hypothetical protein
MILKDAFDALRKNCFRPLPLPLFSHYGISPRGILYNEKTKRTKKGLIENGYVKCTLYNDKVKLKTTIHRLLGLTYIPNPNGLPTIDHKNRIKADNNLSNLCWCSYTNQLYNQKLRRDNTSGHKNIYKRPDGYRLEIWNGGARYTKSFNTLEKAISARNEYYVKINREII